LQQDDVQIRLFPNPVNDVLNIKAEGIIVAPYHLVNMQGQVVLEGVLQSSELLDVSKLGSGLYRIILYSQQEILTLPFVKE
jgi:hypothetical protein